MGKLFCVGAIWGHFSWFTLVNSWIVCLAGFFVHALIAMSVIVNTPGWQLWISLGYLVFHVILYLVLGAVYLILRSKCRDKLTRIPEDNKQKAVVWLNKWDIVQFRNITWGLVICLLWAIVQGFFTGLKIPALPLVITAFNAEQVAAFIAQKALASAVAATYLVLVVLP